MSERAHKWLWFTAAGSITPILIFAIILWSKEKWGGFGYLIERRVIQHQLNEDRKRTMKAQRQQKRRQERQHAHA